MATGIYTDLFIKLLKDNLGQENVKITASEIIVPCPFCETNISRKHFHMYISLEAPVFHCFYAGCHQKGVISRLIRKIVGESSIDKYIDDKEILNKKEIKVLEHAEKRNIVIPEIQYDNFKLKTLYMKERTGYNSLNIKNMIFDINLFFEKNYLNTDKISRFGSYIQTNFVGFLTEHNSMLVMRNIDKTAKMKHFKVDLYDLPFPDYYKIEGPNYNSNSIIVAEGVFDILSEYNYKRVEAVKDCKFLVAGLSSFYESIIKSIVFYEQLFKFDLHILSDRDVGLDNYKYMKKNISYLFNKITVYYNTTGKDFADHVGGIEKFVL